MITDDELDALPTDPELAFVQLERLLRDRVGKYESDARNNDFDADPYRREYMTRVVAAVHQYQIEALFKLEVPRLKRASIYDEYAEFCHDVDFVTMQIRIAAAQHKREGSVQLDSTMKRKLHHYIQQIRDLIEQADLTPEKKDELLSKLNKFAAEVDRTRTRLQAAMAFYISVCDGIGEGFEKLKPVKDMIDSISTLLGNAKSIEDKYTKQLPPAPERKRLEPPKDRVPPPASDDDIPF